MGRNSALIDTLAPPVADFGPSWFCGNAGCDGKAHAGFERPHARGSQNPPPADDPDWLVWLILAGRGYGKTRVGSEFTADQLKRNERWRWALIGSTFTDGRDTMVEGESGLLRIIPPSLLIDGSTERSWNRSLGELKLANGSQAKLFTSERPRQLRGPQHHGAWGDEPFHWTDAHLGDADDSTFSNLLLGLRLGPHPRLVLTSTPKRVRLLMGTTERPGVRDQPSTVVTRGSTYENLDNLAPTFRAQVLSKYEGTTLGRQELHAEVLDDVEGALWTTATIDTHRVIEAPSDLTRIVVAIDPAATGGEAADDTGIVVAGRNAVGEFFVLDDASMHGSPDAWGHAALTAFDDHNADRVIAETNNGGDMIEALLRTKRPLLPYTKVTASRGKRTRAEPIAALYEQGRVHHVGMFTDLEDEMTTWVPGMDSPDRMDALVWAITSLMTSGPVSSGTAAGMVLPRMTPRSR